jgi:hypothetical protein
MALKFAFKRSLEKETLKVNFLKTVLYMLISNFSFPILGAAATPGKGDDKSKAYIK